MESLHTFILVLHVLGATLLVGTVFFAVVLIFREPFFKPNLGLFKLIGTMATGLAGWQLLTGLYLFFSERDKFQDNPLFWVKMGLYVASGIVSGGILKARVARMAKEAQGETVSTRSARSTALIGFLIVLAIATLGVVLAESGS